MNSIGRQETEHVTRWQSDDDAETHSLGEYEALLRADFPSFAQHCFHELNRRTGFVPNWHFEMTAARLEAVRAGGIGRIAINMPPRPPEVTRRVGDVSGAVPRP